MDFAIYPTIVLHISSDLYFIGSAVHDSYLLRLQISGKGDGVKRKKLEDGMMPIGEQSSKMTMRIEDQLYCIAPIRDVIINERTKNSFVIASGQGKLGFISTLYVDHYLTI